MELRWTQHNFASIKEITNFINFLINYVLCASKKLINRSLKQASEAYYNIKIHSNGNYKFFDISHFFSLFKISVIIYIHVNLWYWFYEISHLPCPPYPLSMSRKKRWKYIFHPRFYAVDENSKSFGATLSKKEYNDIRAAVDNHRGVYLL